ncbi:glycosyltransferase [Blastococcus deserti]|uniref:Glycosyltransferase n=1 Tax=Blastococcus deserti TaxID=2259033 RepID=A0ABW4XD27_9ACTN
MRVLVVATPLPGHVLPLVPLARALRDAGHEVTVATAGDALTTCPGDLDPVDVAPRLRLPPLFVRFAFRHPRLARTAAAGRDEGRAAGLLWAPVNERMADGVTRLADRQAPNLIVHEPFAAAAAHAAARRGVPAVVVENSLFDAGEQFAVAADAYARRRVLGRIPDPAEVVTTAPPSLVGRRRGRPMRFVPPGTGEPAPDDLGRPGEHPRVLVSRSTVAADPRRDRLMSTVVAAAAGMDLEVVLVRPDRWVARRSLPANVRTTGWVPFPAVLPAAAAVVHHGGAGTLLTALAAGVPQLVVPGAGDRRVNAELVAARGAGLGVPLPEITSAVLDRLITDDALATAAREVAAEMAAMPAPTELVGPLAALGRAVR